MRKLFSLFAALLFAGSMIATEVVITPSELTAAEATEINQTVGDVTLAITNGTITDQQIRIFATQTLTLSVSSGNITKVVITCTAKDTEKYGPGCFAAQEGNYSYAEYVGTWEGEAASVSLTSTGKQVRATEIRVTIGGATPATPAEQLQGYINDLTLLKNFLEPFSAVDGVQTLISQAETLIATGNAILASGNETQIQNALAQVQAYAQTVITQALAKGKEGFAAQLDALLVAAGDCSECPAIIEAAKEALNGLAWDDSKSVQQNLEAIQRQAEQFIADAQARIDAILNPSETITCREVYAKSKDDAVALSPVLVTYVNGKNVWVKDATGAMLLYLPANATWEAGNILTGVEGVVDVYNDLYEVKPSAEQVAAVEVSDGGGAPAPMEVSTVTSGNMNEYIIMRGLALEGEFTSAQSTSIAITEDVVLFNKFKYAFTFEAGKTYDVIGVISIFKGALQVNFISAEESGDTPIVVTPDYYLVGNMTGWAVDEAYKLSVSPAAANEYKITVTLAADAQFKIVGVDAEGAQTWFPDGMGNNYGENGELAGAGDYEVTFNPEGGVQEWFYGYFNVVKVETPIVEGITCREVYAKAKNDAVLLNPVVVTYVNGKNVWVRDASGAMLLYLSANATWEAGDILTGVEGVVDIYNDLYEVKPSADQVAAVAVEHGEAPDPVEPVSLDDVNSDIMNEYIILKDIALEGEFTSAKSTSINLSEALVLFNKFKYEFTFEAGKTYDILGVVSIFKGALQVNFISAEESGDAPVVDPLTFTFEETEEGINVIPSDNVQSWDFYVLSISDFQSSFGSDPDALAAAYFEQMGAEYAAPGEGLIDFASLLDPDYWGYSAGEYVLIVWGADDSGVTSPAATYEFTLSSNEPSYYLVGNMTGWAVDEAFALSANPRAEGEYMITVSLEADAQFKIVGVDADNNQTWYPDGMGNNYGENGELTEGGDYVVYFRPEGGVEDWFYGYIFVEALVPGEVVEVANSEGLQYDDYCSTSGWWQIYGTNDEYSLSVSNLSSETAPGTYGIADLDAEWTWYVPANTTDTVHFVSGSVTLTVDEEGAATLVGSLLGDDGKTYRFNLVVSLPETVEVTLNVTNYSFGVASGVGAYISATAEDGTAIQLVFTTDELVAGTYTEEDLNFDKNYNYVKGADGSFGLVQTATIILTENEEGSFDVEAHLNCSNYTIYHIYMTPPVVEREVTVNITNGELDQTYLSYGIYGFSGVDENGVEVFLEIWPDEVPGEFSEADLTNYLIGSGIVDGGVQTSISSISGMIEEQDGAYRVTADALCGNNTLYHITLIVGEWSDAKYYLAGSMNGWAPNADYLFTRNEAAEGNEYMLVTTLAEFDELKVAQSEDGQTFMAWFPDGMDNNYVVDAAHAGDVVIYFRPDGDGGEDWFYGYIYVAAQQVIDINVTTGLIYKDACATSGWWQIYGNFNDGANFITLSNGNTVAEAPGTYTADVLDVNYSFIRDNDTNDKVTFTDGSITLSVDESGKVVIEGQLSGSDGNLYNIHLEYLEPKAEREVTVTIADGQLDDTYVSYGDYAFSGADENGVEVFIEVWPAAVPGEFTTSDLVTYLQGNGIVDGGVETSFFSITGTVEEQDGAYRVIADALCYNNTLYHITLIVGEWSDAKYYLAGSMNDWSVNADYLFAPNPAAEGEYLLVANLAVGDELKVAQSEDGQTFMAWFPDGMDNNYVVDAAHAGEVVIYFRPAGDGGEGWYNGFFYIEGREVVDVTITSGLIYDDLCAEQGWWQIYGNTEDGASYIIFSNAGEVAEAPGIYTVDDLDPSYAFIRDNETGDKVTFTDGSIELVVRGDSVFVTGQLSGNDGKLYNIHLEYGAPVAENEVVVNIADGTFDDTYADYEVYVISGEDANGVYVSFELSEVAIPGAFTEGDLISYFAGSGVEVDGTYYSIFSANGNIEAGETEGSYKLTADILCYNNTLYHVTILIGEYAQGIEEIIATGKAVKVLRDGQVLILKGDKIFNMNGNLVR